MARHMTAGYGREQDDAWRAENAQLLEEEGTSCIGVLVYHHLQ